MVLGRNFYKVGKMRKLFALFALVFITGVSLLFAEPKYSFYLERREEQETNYTVLRCWAIITCNDESWELRLPHTESDIKYLDEPQFEQTAEGFCLKYNWGGAKWTSHDTFFFTFYPYEDEPVLYKVQSSTEIYGSMENGDVGIVSQYDDEFNIEPAIKISRLGAEKMERLIPDAGLARIEGAGHFSFLENAALYNAILASFLKL